MNVIEARGLTKVYGGRAVVRDFAMTVAAGDIYGFVGKNGAGKSTVMKMICGDALPTAGEVVLFESDRASAGDGEPEDGGVRRIGVLIEEPGLLVNLSAYRNLMAKALAWGIVDGPARCEEVLRLVGLSSVGNKKVRGFSLGMKQRLGLAMALLGSPDVLLLDEPFNGLDPEATRAMRNLIVRVNETLGITVVVSSHVLDQLDRMPRATGSSPTAHGARDDGRRGGRRVSQQPARSHREPGPGPGVLEEAYPALAFKAEPDGALVVAGDYDDGAISRLLARSGEVVRELSQDHRDLEEYFVELMEGGAQYV